ncbi:Tigger transposable element-derived protein 6-like [Oopsacas minuta]|uniref:Tigger transposable element-derived protein 6-like n=1 Tax=Oopsacas minuta TaxID=111878 RepID=A0AAV7KPM0_9METZ|nr:Tigger transposable element-derived protein 6-like [Oopsacas minuta]
MRNQNRHILVFLDNTPCHPRGASLTNIKLVFLPANTTSVLHPLDQDIIQCMKLLYRKRLLRRVLSQINNGCEDETVAKSINILDACHWIVAAVKEIRPSTVQKCFSKCGINLNFEDDAANNEDEEIQTLTKLLNISSEHNICDNAIVDPQSYVNMDSEIQVNDNLEGEWESRILENLQENVTQEYLSDEGETIEHPGTEKFGFSDALS